ncbi:MAG: ATP-binding protein [Bacteroidota bacterium]
MIDRSIQPKIKNLIQKGKTVVVFGPRQVGKTTLMRALAHDIEHALWVNGDDINDKQVWDNASLKQIQSQISGYDWVIFDEAQRIENIGISIKLIIDNELDIRVFATGSSSLNLASSVNESLTGRRWTFELFPISWTELVSHQNLYPTIKELDHLLVYGMYPEVVTSEQNPETLLQEIANSYLYKDILEFGDIRKPELVVQLLRAIAYQIGGEVSYHELAKTLKTDEKTIRRYVHLLEESYVIFRLPPLSRNPRKELSTKRKIYFVDNGIRNMLVNDLTPFQLRNDQGQLWENFIVSEIRKKISYGQKFINMYFWKSYSQAEIDLVLHRNSSYHAFEIKLNPKKKPRFNKSFLDFYQPKKTQLINRDNFYELLGESFQF